LVLVSMDGSLDLHPVYSTKLGIPRILKRETAPDFYIVLYNVIGINLLIGKMW
jgi:hypothetical protein